MNIQREQQIKVWLTEVLGSEQFEINYLAGDASFRRYARIKQNNKTFMLMDAPPEKEDCEPFVRIDEFLAHHGVRVPQIQAKSLEHGLLLLEDFGDVVLAQKLNQDTVQEYYTQCFTQLSALQAIDATAQLPHYSREKLLIEMQLLTTWFIPSIGLQLSKSETNTIEETFNLLLDNALAQPQVIVHRDFHSRNLMVLENQSTLGVIDFQDAVIGADTYDLISLVRDAYVRWPVAQVNAWIEQFYVQLPSSHKQQRDMAQFKKDADFMALQRHIKILGIFVRLFERDGKQNYLKDLPLVMWYVLEQSQRYPELNAFYQLLEQKIRPAFEQKYGACPKVTL
ncbi:aminoglycoside phosphotransferase family protein [Acinetobacter rathckeae]|uniref:aminoglycoside phosphotransferase family protein n=1 Tax=Acinetobacter rathckeae TaxID=2605272 RepID=UPI0018A2A3B7|nr:phosphotransferase [Acinetobacter rathckeae]MBF7687644.1 phosphotransferase [Acinetobacter rathckeae]MBF7695046.1 phosphotransferase [Acinetobacter rathckeae]